MSSSGRYIGNPLFEATASVPTSTQTTSKSSGFFQDISDATSRRQAFSFGYSADSPSTTRHRRSNHLFSLDSPEIDSRTGRYLGVPNSYSSNVETARFSLESLPPSRESSKLPFSRHHSVDSPEQVRQRSQFR